MSEHVSDLDEYDTSNQNVAGLLAAMNGSAQQMRDIGRKNSIDVGDGIFDDIFLLAAVLIRRDPEFGQVLVAELGEWASREQEAHPTEAEQHRSFADWAIYVLGKVASQQAAELPEPPSPYL